ncbi:NAD(P)/FAD-dependent oxidoreductase [Actinokineospora enzanensis]|uniref:NAD(P)/FAD-dependent oxidoreductase n=1 Tax=Actinokineospora enzanensis TaxID=155975 RepID=UPI00039D1275|nr:FAD-dependent oxidoreductase [Actinokineospora enzanensis]
MVANVVVVGAGVYGAATAWSLARRGAQVTVVEAGEPGSGTSAATFSWINANGKQPRAYHRLNVAGMAAHRKLAAEVPDNDWYHETGNLEWATDDDARARLRARVAELQEWGYDVDWLNRADARAREPGLDPAALPETEIAYYPREGWLRPDRLIPYLLSTNLDLVVGDAVAAIRVTGGEVRSIRLASGRELPADAVVDCAGPRAAQIADLVGLTLPMRNTRGLMVRTAPTPVPVRHVIHSPALNLRPNGDGRLILRSLATDAAAYEPGTEERAANDLLTAARALYPELDAATVTDTRVGERAIPGDNLPLLGRAAKIPNFHFAVSHSGATLCLHGADLVAAEIMGEDRDVELAPFRFERF